MVVMKDEHRKGPTHPMKHDESLDKVFDTLAEALHEDEMNRVSSNLESFDSYVERMHARIYRDLSLFRSRFSNGYRVLLEELNQEKNAHENSKNLS